MKTWHSAGLAALAVLACGDKATVTETPQAPVAPASVTAKIQNDSLILSWADVPEATSYKVYMAAQAGVKRVNYTTLSANMLHTGLFGKFNHPAGLDANLKYYLVVTAVNPAGESGESCEVAAVIATKYGETC